MRPSSQRHSHGSFEAINVDLAREDKHSIDLYSVSAPRPELEIQETYREENLVHAWDRHASASIKARR